MSAHPVNIDPLYLYVKMYHSSYQNVCDCEINTVLLFPESMRMAVFSSQREPPALALTR